VIPALPATGSPLSAQALPQVDDSALPPEVRRGSAEDKKAYRAALGFERTLVLQLVKSMTEATEAQGLNEEDQPATPAAYRDMFAESLADGVARAGGLGLAQNLYKTLKAETR